LIGELEVASVRNATGETGHPHAKIPYLLRQVQRRGLTVDRRRRRQDDFSHAIVPDATPQPIDRHFSGAHSLERRHQLAQDEIEATHGPAALDRKKVLDPRNHAQQCGVASTVATDRAERRLVGTAVGNMSTALASVDAFVHGREVLPELARDGGIRNEQEEGEAQGGFLTDSGEACESLGQSLELIGKHGGD
jgi:hypothetical protein